MAVRLRPSMRHGGDRLDPEGVQRLPSMISLSMLLPNKYQTEFCDKHVAAHTYRKRL